MYKTFSPRNYLQTRYQLLSAIGISYWLPRFSHSTSTSLLISQKPVFCAACLVLLPEALASSEIELKQILDGMCKVLELKEEELCIAWFTGNIKSQDKTVLHETIASWAPYSILMMGEDFAKNLLEHDAAIDALRMHFQTIPGLEAVIQITYHPKELQQNKAYKRKAYEDLLRLKEHLASVKIS